MAEKVNPKTIFAWLLTLGAPLGILMIPTTELFTVQMRIFLVITVFSILVIALGTLPQSAITFLMPVSYVLFGLADTSLAWFPWTMPTVWMTISALLLVNSLESSGVLMRISYKVILLVGGSYKGLILGMGLLGIVLNIILFGNAFVMLAGLAYGLCRALDLKKLSKEAAGIFLAAAVGGVAPGMFCYGANIIMLEGIGESVVGPMRISYLDFTFFNAPLIIYYMFAILLVLLMFRSKMEISGKAYFQSKLEEMGKMKISEKKAAIWLVILFSFSSDYCSFRRLGLHLDFHYRCSAHDFTRCWLWQRRGRKTVRFYLYFIYCKLYEYRFCGAIARFWRFDCRTIQTLGF